jgi:riboflavin kinase / FMN adenylyltransferase
MESTPWQSHSGRNHTMNIGTRPTVEGMGRTQEVHIFDFNDDIYGENLTVELVNFIREETKFDNLELLIQQINLDIKNCKQILKIDA